MNTDKILKTVEQFLLSRQLSPIERLILEQSWNGRTYSEMAVDSGYGSIYLKEIGSHLWEELSEAIGKRVTKKNLHLVLSQYQPNRIVLAQENMQQELQGNHQVNNYLATSVAVAEIEFPSGPVAINSPFYINRPPIEEIVCSEINKPGCVLRIKAPKKMGKSSLLNRIVAFANQQNYQTAYLDFQEADENVFASLDRFLRWFSANISYKLNLSSKLDDYWDEDMGSKVSCKIYFEGYLLESIEQPIVLILNEVNRVFEHPNIAQDFLPMLRFWHEQGRTVETWQKLRLVLAHSTEIYVPLKLNQSPFNVGIAVKLPQFSIEQVQDLAARYGLDWQEGRQAEQLMSMVGGHPYLVSLALYHLRRINMPLAELLQTAPMQNGIYIHHLRRHLAMLQDQPELAAALQMVLTASLSVKLDAIATYKLESMGLVEVDSDGVKPSCELYRRFFLEQLNQGNLFAVSEEHSIEEKQQSSQNLDNIDPLTQLPNQRYFNQALETEWQQRIDSNTNLGLIFCDIDYFKFYNEARGIAAGDDCLQQVANIIRNCTKEQTVILSRYGGTKFAIMIAELDPDTVVHIAETIRASVKALELAHDRSKIEGFPAPVITVSLGVASLMPARQSSPNMLISAAEAALSRSRREGRDRVSVTKE